MPASRLKKRSRSMDRPCMSSWIGAHENFQEREYDAGASPTSSEPARKTMDSWTSTNAKFENSLKLLHYLKCSH
jgi:hypothetical protein